MQVARLQREERLGALQVELASGKVLRLTQLRGFARVVRFLPPSISRMYHPNAASRSCMLCRLWTSVPQPSTPYSKQQPCGLPLFRFVWCSHDLGEVRMYRDKFQTTLDICFVQHLCICNITRPALSSVQIGKCRS